MTSIILVYALITSCCLSVSTPFNTSGPFDKEDNENPTGNNVTHELMSLAAARNSAQHNIADSEDFSNDAQHNIADSEDFSNDAQHNIADSEDFSNDAQHNIADSEDFSNEAQVTNNLNVISDDSDAYGLNISDIIRRQLESIGLEKRQACPMPASMMHDLTELYKKLNTSHYLTKNTGASPRVRKPLNQLIVCPENPSDFKYGIELNSLATCPWEIIEKDMGVEAFPRYLPNIRCLCERCYGADSRRCEENTADRHYFEYLGCEKGLMHFIRRTYTLGTSCFCRSAGLQMLQEKCREQNQPLFIAFMDVTKAFNFVSRESLFKTLKIGCPPTLLSIVESFPTDMMGIIKFDGASSEEFEITSLVKQNCELAPTIFGIYFSLLLK